MKLLLFFLLFLFHGFLSAGEESCSRGSPLCDYRDGVQRIAASLGATFREIVDTEMGAAAAARLGNPNLSTKELIVPATQEILSDIADRLSAKLTAATRALRELRESLSSTTESSFTHPCPYHSLQNAIMFRKLTNENLTLETQMKDGFKDLKIKRQYYLSHIDYATDRECSAMAHSNLRFLYHKVLHPDPKLVVLVIDNSIQSELLQYANKIVKEIVQTMKYEDKFALKITNTSEFLKFEDLCSKDEISELANATDNNKLLLKEYVLMIDTASNNLPISDTIADLKSLLNRDNLPKHKLVIVLTDGKITTESSWQEIVDTPKKPDEQLIFSIGVLNSSGEHGNSSLGILHFDKLHHSETHSVMRMHINNTAVVGQVASAFLSLLPQKYDEEKIVLESPIWEATERDFLVPLVIPTKGGILGLDLYWSDLAEDIIYFQRTDIERWAFVIDMSGKVIMHTFFPRPDQATEKIKFASLETIENCQSIHNIKQEMLLTSQGNVTAKDDFTNKTLIYTWRWIQNLYVACVVTAVNENEQVYETYNGTESYFGYNLAETLFHRLDLFPPKNGKLCRHFRQVATTERATVYLSPSAFRSAAAASRDPPGPEYLQNCLAYLRGAARGLLVNPGLRPRVRRDVAFVGAVAAYLRLSAAGPRRHHIVRRYIATDSGALAMFPGAVLARDFEPARRGWYHTAVANPSRLVMSAPALDAGGAGYVVTLSRTLHGPHPSAVTAMDVPPGYLLSILQSALPACTTHARCFLMNSRGYLLAHPTLPAPAAAAAPAERLHVTRGESMIAIDMLGRSGLVTKQLCADAADGTIQRHYEFNVSLSGVVTNAGNGEHCARYYVAAVPGTDAFAVVVNTTCASGAFCPCSTVDRLCLNCRRMEQTECECPCECPAERCEAPQLQMCPPPVEAGDHESRYFHTLAETLPLCYESECHQYVSQVECAAAVGCEWCAWERDGKTPHSSPSCAAAVTCWGGVLGAVTPYGEAPARDADDAGGYGALGPAAGALVMAALVLAVFLYCYRAGGERECPAAAAAAGEWTEAEGAARADEPAEVSGWDRLLPAADEAVSPYRVLSATRRARHAGSDHGYSTMTPHEDSETAGMSGEPGPLSDDTRSDVSAPLPQRAKLRAPALTALTAAAATSTSMHNVLVPVTVHRHMEAS